MRIAVFGASGRTGEPFVRKALENGNEVNAFVREKSRLEASGEGLQIFEGDVYTGEKVSECVEDADAIVSVLGQNRNTSDDLLTVGGENIIEAMDKHGVERFVTLVGAGVREEGEKPSLSGKIIGLLLKLVNPEILKDAEDHTEKVRDSGLDWTIIRAPRLTGGEERGDYRTGDVSPGMKGVSRDDVADFILDCVENDRYIHEMPKITY